MFEASQNLEQVSLYFAPQVVIIPGVLCLVLGLFVWLGGLRWNRFIAVLVGVFGGALLACRAAEYQIATITLAVLVGGGLGMFFKRIAVVLVGVVIVATAALIIAEGPVRETTNPLPPKIQVSDIDGSAERLNIFESLEIMNSYFRYYSGRIGSAVRDGAGSPEGLTFALVGGVAVAALGSFLPRFTVSAVSSALGTGLIFVGMVLILFYKGARPISHVYERAWIYNTVIVVMIVFGTAVELLLCSSKNKKPNIVKPNIGEK